MGWIGWIVLGALAGMVAKAIMHESGGLLKNIFLGIIGAIVGGWVFALFDHTVVIGFNVYSFIVAVIGAIIVIWIARLITRRT